jgi:hypothetical protein
MQSVSNGYTIIEVLIFLAVSAVLMTFSFNLINGKQAEAEFNQKMRDTRSQIQDWLNDASTGLSGADSSNSHCTVSGNSPPIIDKNSLASPQPQCIYIGKAVQFTDSAMSADQSERIFGYSVFGRRLSAGTGDLPVNLADSSPIAATGQGSGDRDLTQEFNIAPLQVKSVTANGPYTGSHLIGFYNSFNTEQTTAFNGSTDLNIFEYNFSGSTSAGNTLAGSAVRDCLKLVAPCSNPATLTSYQVCLTDGHRTARLSISSPNGTGAETNIEYVSC